MPLLLILGYVWPEPNSSAAGWRMLSLIQIFREKQWRIIFASPAELSVHRFDLTSWGVDEVQIELNSSSFDEATCKLATRCGAVRPLYARRAIWLAGR